MPGILGALISVMIAGNMAQSGFDQTYLNEGKYGHQATKQLYGLFTTLAMSILSGAAGGWICSFPVFQPVHALFRDDDHVFGALLAYPKSFLADGDEAFDAVERIMIKIRRHIHAQKDENAAWSHEDFFEDVWQRCCGAATELRQGQEANIYL